MKQNLPNILLISIDGVRADVAYSGKFKTLSELYNNSVVFKKVVSAAPLTPISHATVLSGLYPEGHGIRHLFLEQMLDEVTTLPQILKRYNYSTSAIVSCPGLNKWYGFSRGFDSYDDKVPLTADGKDALHTVDVKTRGFAAKKADEVCAKTVQLLDNLDQSPFFYFIHFFDAHWPYLPPVPYSETFKDNMYEGEVAYIDKYLGELFETLKQKGLYDDLLLIVFADHGEDLNGLYSNDHGGEQLGHPEEEGHGSLLYDATQMVPLMIKLPKKDNKVKIIDKQVRLVDITPTILEYLGINVETGFNGVSLINHINGEGNDLVGYSETFYPLENAEQVAKYPNLHNLKAIRIKDGDTEYKVIWHMDSDFAEVYNLNSDPDEKRNLFIAQNIKGI